MIEVVQYEPHHIDEVMKRPREWEIRTAKHPDWEMWKRFRRESGPARTIIVDGEVIGCGGVMIVREGVGEAWMIFTDLICRYPKTVYRECKRFVGEIVRECGLEMIEAFIEPDFRSSRNLARCMGFIEGEPTVVCGVDMIRFWRKCK